MGSGVFDRFGGRRHRRSGGSHKQENSTQHATGDEKRVLMVGNPNVGKSALFNRLTGRYVVVSNYPGTTVAVSKGRMKHGGKDFSIIDTPGMYSLYPITEEERVGRKMILEEDHDVVLHVVDAKNLSRMLPFTLQLLEAGLPLILVLNIMDEAKEAGLSIDMETLEKRLGIPVVPTVSISGKGVRRLTDLIKNLPQRANGFHVDYGLAIERTARELAPQLPETLLTRRGTSLLALQEDRDVRALISTIPTGGAEKILNTINQLKKELEKPVNYYLIMGLRRKAEQILEGIIRKKEVQAHDTRGMVDRLLINPWTGLPVLGLVLYYGFYKFVGGFGAGTVVDFLEGHLFESYFIPFIDGWTERLIPWPVIQDLIAKEYGVLTMGVRYAVAIVMPIVGAFFIVFSLVEDSGYLPRLSLLIDRLFKKIGLSGRAVIPMTLGFGCGTMATMVTRTLESTRERVIATILLALAIPCSAQLGVIFALAAKSPGILVTWIAVVAFVFLFIGYLTAKILPGKEPDFFMELPPLRMPRLANVWIKTSTRMRWYFMEILPLFLLASVLIWAGNLTGLFDMTMYFLSFPTNAIGLPDEAAQAFLFGFFRRDYGVAGLYDIQQGGLLTANQLAVATITLTLFLPCIAQFLVMMKERGWKVAVLVAAFVFPFAFLVGGTVNFLLNAFGIKL
ncbi:ferrous iron transport protein B [bacterium]|nr:MAG: ferrous iron transport protein B [bacterium]